MSTLFDRPFTFDRVIRILISLLILGGIFYLITILKGVLLPFFIAWILAYFLQPFVHFFQYKLKLKSRVISIFSVMLVFVGVLTLLVLMIKPSFQSEIERFSLLINQYNLSSHSIPFVPEQWIDYIRDQIDFKELEHTFDKENLVNMVKQLLPGVWDLLSGTIATIASITVVFIIFMYLFFILLDYEKIADGWIRLIPGHARPIVARLASEIGDNMNRYFRGQALIASLVGVFLAVGFNIIGLPLGIVLGLFIGVLNMVPYLQIIGIVPMVLLCLLKTAETGQNFWLILGLASLVMIIVQVLQDFILTPRIMGKAMGLNPAIILLSLSIWGTLLGFIGLIIALPLTVILEIYYKRFILAEDDTEEIPVKEEKKKKRQ
ncbi:MAG: AI-2E family transporter [Bacteroidales bacterium]|nr:AI-2E family transporter [Bacteroidales bacterium]